MSKYESINMSQVKVGDILVESGLRCEVLSVMTFPGYPSGRPVYVAPGRILNPEFLLTEHGIQIFGGLVKRDGSEAWVFQGNDGAYVFREV